MDASVFSSYFGHCPVVKVHGRTFPVETIYLEDIYEMLDYQLASDSPAAVSSSSVHWKKNVRRWAEAQVYEESSLLCVW